MHVAANSRNLIEFAGQQLTMRKMKDTETPVYNWLHQVGCADIRFVGGGNEDGPPDFIAMYHGKEVAVEATLLRFHADTKDAEEWDHKNETAIRRVAGDIYKQEREKGCGGWHIDIEFDRLQPFSTMKKGHWKDAFRKALWSESGGEIQLIHGAKKRGRGVTATLYAASNEGGINNVSDGEGAYLLPALVERATAAIREKSTKMLDAKNRGGRAVNYDCRWLALNDEILAVGKEETPLSESEIAAVENGILSEPRARLWGKIVLISRFQSARFPQNGLAGGGGGGDALRQAPLSPPNPVPMKYWALWQNPANRPL